MRRRSSRKSSRAGAVGGCKRNRWASEGGGLRASARSWLRAGRNEWLERQSIVKVGHASVLDPTREAQARALDNAPGSEVRGQSQGH